MNTSKASANEKVTNYVLAQIRDKKLVEGSKLPTEIELSQHLSVGRNAVREALKTLQFIELVQSSKGSGYRLTSSFDNCLRRTIQFLFEMGCYSSVDIRNIREALEIKSLQLIQANGGVATSDIELLNECIDKMSKTESPDEYDLIFHRTIARLSGNPLIYTVIDALTRVSESYVLIPWNDISAEDVNELVVCHKKIVEALNSPFAPLYSENAITQHYNAADSIITRKKSLGELTINDFLANCKSEEDMLQLLGDLWKNRNQN